MLRASPITAITEIPKVEKYQENIIGKEVVVTIDLKLYEFPKIPRLSRIAGELEDKLTRNKIMSATIPKAQNRGKNCNVVLILNFVSRY